MTAITIRPAEPQPDCPCPTCQATRHDFCTACGHMTMALKEANVCTGCAPGAG